MAAFRREMPRVVCFQAKLSYYNGDQNRWTDFIDALTPVPGKGSFVVGGTVARPTANDDPQRRTFYATVTP